MEFREPPRENYRLHDSHIPVPPAEHHPRPAETPPPKKKSKRKLPRIVRRWWKWAIAVLIVAVVVGLGYGYIHTKNELTKLSNPKTAGQSETQQIITQVSKSVDLPTGETPALATVSDASKLKTQAFFKNAQNGDKVLIYTKAGVALLYRPSSKKIVQFAPLNLNGK